MPDLLYERAIELMEAPLGEEIVALDPEGGICFGFNSAAASVWRQLSEPRSFADLKAGLLREFDVHEQECEADLLGLLDQLTAEGLVRVRSPDLPQRKQ